jgi:hypothetical protein
MLKNADIVITAVENEKIIGVARSVTDFNYCFLVPKFHLGMHTCKIIN